MVEPELDGRSELQSFEGVSVDRLQQMFRKSKERMANAKQDAVDAYNPNPSASISRANSGSTTASSSRRNQGFGDGASDAGSDGLPLGAEWYSFNQR